MNHINRSHHMVVLLILAGALACAAARADLTPTEARANLQAAVARVAAEQLAKQKRAKAAAERKAKAEQAALERGERHRAAEAARAEAETAIANAELRRAQDAAWIAAAPERERKAMEERAAIAAWRASIPPAPSIVIVNRGGRVLLSVNGKTRECVSQAEAEELAEEARR